MTKPDYTVFDKALLENIAAGRNTLSCLDSKSSGLQELAKPFLTKDRWGDRTPTFRIIDRRLQALRRQGKIRFDGKTWVRLNIDGTKA